MSTTYKFQKNQYVTYSYSGTTIRAQVIDHVKEPGETVEQEDGQTRKAKEGEPAYKLKIDDESSSSNGKTVVKSESDLSAA